ncbi:holo-ACP synthase [Hydrogenophilus islandicus]
MILGVGVDLVAIARVARLWQRHGRRFAARILTDGEAEELATRLAGCADEAAEQIASRFLAKRFAAKEAFAKAWGTGIGAALSFHDLAVTHDERGRPEWRFAERFAERFAARGAVRAHLSLSDELNHALAFVVIEGVSRG